MNIDQPLYWHQGLFLQPQHFQHNDARLEHRLTRAIALSNPYAWGLISFQLNDAALSARQCRFEQLSVRFPGGTLAEFPGNAILESRALTLGDFANDGRNIYIGLKRSAPGEPDAQVYENLNDARQADSRFAVLADPEVLEDRLGDGPEARVRPMYYVLRLFWEEEAEHLSAYELLSVGRLEQDGDRIRLTERYIPPCVCIGASPMLMQLLRDTRDEVVGRARQLEVYKQSGDARRGDFDASQMTNLLALSTLNSFGPQLTHLLETPQVSPWLVYGTLRQLIGALSLFSDRCDMLGQTSDGRSLVSAYHHEDSGLAIIQTAALIGRLLNEISIGSELLVRLSFIDGLYQAVMPEGFFGTRHRYYLVARGDREPASLVEMITLDGKLGAPDYIAELINRALPGVELIYMQVPPQGLPRRPGALYFRLETLSEAWEAIQQQKAVTLFLPGAPEDLLVELVVMHA